MADTLKVGDSAPSFDLPTYPTGRAVLADFAGKKNVILAFYPKDDTPGCTREMCAFSTDNTKFADSETVVFGISCDDTESHAAFAKKYNLVQTLLADADGSVGRAYGTVTGSGGFADRVLFVIDKKGIIRHIHKGMPDNAALLEMVRGLN